MNYKVLLVDDHTLVRKGFKALLLTHYPDWEIREAENGVQAILTCSSVKQDIILMDFDMPKLDGLTAARQILQESPGVKILMVSMHNGLELAESLRECGVMGIVHKNAGDEEFLYAISRIRQGIKHFPAAVSGDENGTSVEYIAAEEKEERPPGALGEGGGDLQAPRGGRTAACCHRRDAVDQREDPRYPQDEHLQKVQCPLPPGAAAFCV